MDLRCIKKVGGKEELLNQHKLDSENYLFSMKIDFNFVRVYIQYIIRCKIKVEFIIKLDYN